MIFYQKKWPLLFAIPLFYLCTVFMFDYIYNYIWLQGTGYLYNKNFGMRATGLIWILLDLIILYLHFVRISFPKSISKPIVVILIAHLAINIIFLFSSHLSGRLSKPFEPLIIALFTMALINNLKEKNIVWCLLGIPILLPFVLVTS